MDINLAKIKLELLENGYSTAKSFFSEDELADICDATDSLINDWYELKNSDPDYWNYSTPEDGVILYRIHNLEKNKHPAIDRFLANDRLPALARSLYGFEATPTAFALIIKLAKIGGPVPWHRDPVNVPAGCIYNFSILLDDSNPQNGCLEMLPGSHCFPKNYPVKDERPDGSIFLPSRKGDVTIHDVRIIHGSGPSLGLSQRRSIVIEYCPKWILELRESRILK